MVVFKESEKRNMKKRLSIIILGVCFKRQGVVVFFFKERVKKET